MRTNIKLVITALFLCILTVSSRAGYTIADIGFEPTALNNDGWIIGTNSNGSTLFSTPNAVDIAINDIPAINPCVCPRTNNVYDITLVTGRWATPVAINDSGVIVGNSARSSRRAWAFDVVNDVCRILNDTGLRATVLGVTEDNQFIGTLESQSYSKIVIWPQVDASPITVGFGRLSPNFVVPSNLKNFDLTFCLPVINGQVLDYNSGTAVGFVWSKRSERAFLATENYFVDLNSLVPNLGWVLQQARAINENGAIVGVGLHNGVKAGFILTPVVDTPITTTLPPSPVKVHSPVRSGSKADKTGGRTPPLRPDHPNQIGRNAQPK